MKVSRNGRLRDGNDVPIVAAGLEGTCVDKPARARGAGSTRTRTLLLEGSPFSKSSLSFLVHRLLHTHLVRAPASQAAAEAAQRAALIPNHQRAKHQRESCIRRRGG